MQTHQRPRCVLSISGINYTQTHQRPKVCAFHLRNRNANHELSHLVRYRTGQHMNTSVPWCPSWQNTITQNTSVTPKQKVNARNNIIHKLANSKWGSRIPTLRSSGLALCYSAAEYACAIWARSTHANKLNSTLHDCCYIITGCLKPTNIDSLHLRDVVNEV